MMIAKAFCVWGLQINPDSAKGYKARGMARAMLGEWAEAAKDLHLASTIDYDEEISAVLKKVLILVFEFHKQSISVSFLMVIVLK